MDAVVGRGFGSNWTGWGLEMLGRLKLIAREPSRYLPLACRYAAVLPLRWLSRLMTRAPFYLQEQMDIHPASIWRDRRFLQRTGGFFLLNDGVKRRLLTPQPWDPVRRDMLVLLLRSVIERAVPGDMAELGVFRGDSARLLHHYAPDRVLHLFDTFSGFSREDVERDACRTGVRDVAGHFEDTSVARVLRRIAPVGDRLRIHAGHFPDSIPAGLDGATFAFVHLDVDLYQPILEGLSWFYPRLSPGGFLVVHDYNAWLGPRQAVDEFSRRVGCLAIPLPDKNGSALLVKPPRVA